MFNRLRLWLLEQQVKVIVDQESGKKEPGMSTAKKPAAKKPVAKKKAPVKKTAPAKKTAPKKTTKKK
jgi:hypothetical protein